MSRWTIRGAWHITFKEGASAETDRSCEVRTAEHNEGGRSTQVMVPACGTSITTTGAPEDSLVLEIAHDLASDSLWTWLETNEGKTAAVAVWPDLTDAPTVCYTHEVQVMHAQAETLSAVTNKVAKVTLPMSKAPTRSTRAVPAATQSAP